MLFNVMDRVLLSRIEADLQSHLPGCRGPRRDLSSHKEFAKVSFIKAFDKCRLHKAAHRCTDKHDGADLFVRGHYDLQVYVEPAGRDTAPFSRNVGAQQGQGSSPTLFTTLVGGFLWREWGQIAVAHDRGGAGRSLPDSPHFVG